MKRMLFAAILLASAARSAAPEPRYHVITQLAAGDGGWDLLSVAPGDQRLYVAHGDGVTAIDLRTGKATDHLVAGQRAHAGTLSSENPA